MKERLRAVADQLDPFRLAGGDPSRSTPPGGLAAGETPHLPPAEGSLTAFLNGLATAWQQGEVRATHRRTPRPARDWRTATIPFEAVWPCVRAWLEAEPDRIGHELFERLQAEAPGVFPDGQLRTLQRRVREWRQAAARHARLRVSVYGRRVSGPSGPLTSWAEASPPGIRAAGSTDLANASSTELGRLVTFPAEATRPADSIVAAQAPAGASGRGGQRPGRSRTGTLRSVDVQPPWQSGRHPPAARAAMGGPRDAARCGRSAPPPVRRRPRRVGIDPPHRRPRVARRRSPATSLRSRGGP